MSNHLQNDENINIVFVFFQTKVYRTRDIIH